MLWALGGLGVVGGAALAWLHTEAGQRWAGDQLHGVVQGLLADGFTLSPFGLSWDLSGRLVLTDVVLTGPDGGVIVGVPRLDARLDLSGIASRTVAVRHGRLSSPEVNLTLQEDGLLDLAAAFGADPDAEVDPDAPPWGGLPITLVVDDVALRDGRFVLRHVDRVLADPPPPPEDPCAEPPAPDPEAATVSEVVVDLDALLPWVRADVRLDEGSPAVHVDGAVLRGLLRQPGPLAIDLDAPSITWTGDGVVLESAALAANEARLTVDGSVHGLSGDAAVAARVGLHPLDLGPVVAATGAPLAGSLTGELVASGTLSALDLTGHLDGVPAAADPTRGGADGTPPAPRDADADPAGEDRSGDPADPGSGEAPSPDTPDTPGPPGTRGRLVLGEGTRVCVLPVPEGAEDPCGVATHPALAEAKRGPVAESLRWVVQATLDGLHVEDIAPVVGGPLRLEGTLSGRGGGTAWPGGVVVPSLSWQAEDADAYGVPIRALDATLSLDDGVLGMDALEATAVVGTLSGDGALVLDACAEDAGLLTVDAAGPVDLGMLRDLGVTDLYGTGRASARLRGRVYDEGAPIAVSGRVSGRAVGYGPDVVLGTLDGRFDVDVVDGVTTVSATADATDVEGYGAVVPTMTAPELGVVVDGDGVRVRVRAEADAAAYPPVSTDLRGLVAEVDVDVPTEGPLTTTAAVALDGHAVYGLAGDGGTVDVSLVDDALTVGVDLVRWGQPYARIPELTLDLSTMTLHAEELLVSPTPRQVWTAPRPIHLRLTEAGGVEDATVTLASELGRLTVDGDLGTEGRLSGKLGVEGLDLSVLAELFPMELGGLGGVLDVDLVARGEASQPQISGDVSVEDLWLPQGQGRWLDLTGQVGVRDDLLSLQLDASVEGDALVSLGGSVPVVSDLSQPGLTPDGQADLQLAVAPGSFRRFETVVEGLALPRGQISSALSVTGDLRDPQIRLHGVTEVAVRGLTDRVRLELAVDRQGDRLTLAADGYEGWRRVLATDAEAATRLGEVTEWLLGDGAEPDLSRPELFADDLSGRMQLESVPVRSLLQVADLADYDLSGDLSGLVRLRGSPRLPSLFVDLTAEGRAGGEAFTARVGLDPVGRSVDDPPSPDDAEDGYQASVSLGDGDEDWLVAEGRVPLALRLGEALEDWNVGAYDLSLRGAGLPIGLVGAVDPSLVAQRGRAQLSGAVTGGLLTPVPDLRLEIADAALGYRALGIEATDLDLGVSIRPRTDGGGGESGDALAGFGDLAVRIEDLSLHTQPLGRAVAARESRLSASGEITLDGGLPDDVSVSVSADRAWLMALDDTQLRASTRGLSVSGTYPSLAVRGHVDVEEGRFDLDAGTLLAEQFVVLDPQIAVFRGGEPLDDITDARGRAVVADADGDEAEADEAEAQAEGPGLYESLDVAVTVDLGRNTQTRISLPVFEDLGSFGANLTRAEVDSRLVTPRDPLGVRIRDGEVQVTGVVGLRDGEAGLLRAQFALSDDSIISFPSGDPSNPLLDVQGRMDVAGGGLDLDIQGTPTNLQTTFDSQEYPSTAEQMMILFTGEAPEELSSQQGRTAVEAVSDLLLNSVLGGVNLGDVSVEADGTVRIGVPIGRQVYLESALRPFAELDENRITVEAEVSLGRRVLVTAAYGDRRMWANVFLEYRF